MTSLSAQFQVRVAEITKVAQDIKRFRLVSQGDNHGGNQGGNHGDNHGGNQGGNQGECLPRFSAGAHVTVTMKPSKGRTIRNSYSLMGNRLDTTNGYEISVLRTQNSRGGSEYMHDQVKEGSILTISGPSNLFPIDARGKKFVLFAGGIGITPIMSMADQLSEMNLPFELHYGFRSHAHAAFADELRDRFGARVTLYSQEKSHMIPMAEILRHQKLGTQMYVCGPAPMIDAAMAAGRAAGWPAQSLHFERFQAPAGGSPFQVTLTKSGKTLLVGEAESLLEAVEAAGIDAPYLCRGGACGQCECRVTAIDGIIDHKDHILTESERAKGDRIMICVSRVKGASITIDL